MFWHHIMVSLYIYLKINDVKYLFMCLLAIDIPVFCKDPLKSFVRFFFPPYWFVRVVYMLKFNPLSDMILINIIFLHVEENLFHFVGIWFEQWKFFILTNSNLWCFSFYLGFLGSHLINIRLWKFSLCFIIHILKLLPLY